MIVDYKLLQENRKTLAIHVLPSCEIIIKAPVEAKKSEIENFIKRKKLWIDKQLAYFKEFEIGKTHNFLINGSEIFYLGKQYRLIIKKSVSPKEYVEIGKSDLLIYSLFPNKQERNIEIINNWLEQQQQKQFKQAFNKAFNRFKDMPNLDVKIRKLSRRWGSFMQKGIIVLNPSLIITPRKCIEYVITHEMCHYYHKDHSSEFYSLLGAKLPDWDKTKARLETYSKYI